MKRIKYFTIIVCIMTFFGCYKSKEFYNIIIINSVNPCIVTQYSSLSFVNPSATATDQDLVSVPVSVDGFVNINLAGSDTLIYHAISQSNTSNSNFLIVVVDGAQYISGNYTVTDFSDTLLTGNSLDTINIDTQSYNSVYFKKFAGYNNCNLHGLNIDSTLTIPSQTIYCGSPLAYRTFAGSGVYSKDMTSFVIYYTEVTNSVTKNGHCIYTRN